jgi:hypothetical protein
MELPNTNAGYTDPIPSGYDDEDTPEKRTEAAARLIGLMDEHLVGETVEGPESWRKASLAERLILTERPYSSSEDLTGYRVLEGQLLFRYDENTETGVKQYQISRIPNRHLGRKDADQLTITQDADGVIETFHPKEDRGKEKRRATAAEVTAMEEACFNGARVALYDFDEEKEMMTAHPHYRALVRIQRKTLLRKMAKAYTDLREGRTSDEYR